MEKLEYIDVRKITPHKDNGYEMSDEEKAMRDGTHKVFREERDDG